MNSKEIEILKQALSKMAMLGCKIKNSELKVDGKIVGVGFKPYWSTPYDSKIDKLEINVLDKRGRIIPLNFYHVIGYDIVSSDGEDILSFSNISLDIRVYLPSKDRAEPFEKVRLEITSK